MFEPKWFCPDCHSFWHRWNIHKRSRMDGYDSFEIRYICPECGEMNVLKFSDYLRFKARIGDL